LPATAPLASAHGPFELLPPARKPGFSGQLLRQGDWFGSCSVAEMNHVATKPSELTQRQPAAEPRVRMRTALRAGAIVVGTFDSKKGYDAARPPTAD
jgi:hypothetical protein